MAILPLLWPFGRSYGETAVILSFITQKHDFSIKLKFYNTGSEAISILDLKLIKINCYNRTILLTLNKKNFKNFKNFKRLFNMNCEYKIGKKYCKEKGLEQRTRGVREVERRE